MEAWGQFLPATRYSPDYGPHAKLDEEEKKKRLDAMVRIWQSDTERCIERESKKNTLVKIFMENFMKNIEKIGLTNQATHVNFIAGFVYRSHLSRTMIEPFVLHAAR